MHNFRDLALGAVLGAIVTTTVIAASDEPEMDPVKQLPEVYKVRFENDRVRVIEFRLKPGAKEPMHGHPAGLLFVLADGKVKHVFPDGSSSEQSATAGDVIWREAVTHSGENIGGTEIHAYIVDVKQ